jgi:hypothetical protein
MERTAEIPQLTERAGADGKVRKAKSELKLVTSATDAKAADAIADPGQKAELSFNAAEPEPRQPETYRAPLRRKPKLETCTEIEAARNYHAEKCIELGADIELEIELFAKALRQLGGGKPATTTVQLSCMDCSGKGKVPGKKPGAVVACRKCGGSGIATVRAHCPRSKGAAA